MSIQYRVLITKSGKSFLQSNSGNGWQNISDVTGLENTVAEQKGCFVVYE